MFSQLTQLLPWLRKGAWSLADQWLFSGANFVANIMLARWLLPEEYGAFALGFAIFLLLAALHTAMLSDPMLIFGAGRYRDRLSKYLWFLFACHVVLGLASSLLFGLAAWFTQLLGAAQIAGALWGVCLASPFILLAWLLRRALYIDGQPVKASLASLVYLVFLLAGIVAARVAGQLSVFSAFAIMGAASLLVSFLLVTLLQPGRLPAFNRVDFNSMLADQWAYAKWSGPTSLLIWVPLNIFYVAIPYSANLVGAASLRALNNLLTPLIQSASALTTLLNPQFSRVHMQQGKQELIRRVSQMFPLLVVISFLYWLILWLFGPQILALLYANQYQDLASLLPLAGGIPIVFGAAMLFESVLRAMEQPQRVFRGYLLASIIACTLGAWLTIRWQVLGAVISQLLAFLILGLSLFCSLRKLAATK